MGVSVVNVERDGLRLMLRGSGGPAPTYATDDDLRSMAGELLPILLADAPRVWWCAQLSKTQEAPCDCTGGSSGWVVLVPVVASDV